MQPGEDDDGDDNGGEDDDEDDDKGDDDDDDDDKGDDDDDGYKDDATWEYDIHDDDGWYMRPTSVLPFFAAKCRDGDDDNKVNNDYDNDDDGGDDDDDGEGDDTSVLPCLAAKCRGCIPSVLGTSTLQPKAHRVCE